MRGRFRRGKALDGTLRGSIIPASGSLRLSGWALSTKLNLLFYRHFQRPWGRVWLSAWTIGGEVGVESLKHSMFFRLSQGVSRMSDSSGVE